jgi:hypothetical protein
VQLLDLVQAKHFCTPLGAALQGLEQSLPAFHVGLKKVTHLNEGTPNFAIHRANLLLSAERWLLFSVGHYRRALEMLVPVSAPWAQVTLYYSAFFGANAVLALFGAWIGHNVEGVRIVDVEKGTPGQQQLRIVRGKNVKSPSGARGSHKMFWDFFYDAMPAIKAWVPPHLANALAPVNNDYAWQITSRNSVNYDMFRAWDCSTRFYSSFRPAKLKTLAGPLRLQFEATEDLIRLALHFAQEFALSNSALVNIGFTGDRAHVQRRLVKQAPPSILNQSAFSEFAA